MTGVRIVALKFGAFAAVAVVLLVLLVNTMHNGVSGATTDYHALFTDVSGLRVGDDVKVAGVRVGRVNGIDVRGDSADMAEVTFALSADQPILDNTRLVMRYQNLVGQRYIAMVQPDEHGARLHPEAVVPAKLTDPGFDLTALLNGFRPLFEVLQPQDVNKLATSLVQVLQGEGGTIESLLQQTTRLTTFVADRDQVIGQVLTNLTPVLQNLSGHDEDLSRTVVSLKQLMTGLAKDRKSIGTSIDSVSQLIGSTSSLLEDSRRPLVGSVRQLRTVGAMVAASRAKLVDAIDAYRVAFGTLGRATSYENALNVFICTLKVQLAGAPPINTAGAHPKRSEVCR